MEHTSTQLVTTVGLLYLSLAASKDRVWEFENVLTHPKKSIEQRKKKYEFSRLIFFFIGTLFFYCHSFRVIYAKKLSSNALVRETKEEFLHRRRRRRRRKEEREHNSKMPE